MANKDSLPVEFALWSMHLSCSVNVQQLPVEVQVVIASYLGFRDSVNFYESSSRISPKVLSYSKSPTINDLLFVQNHTKTLECVLKYSKVTNETLQTFLNKNLKKKWVNKDVISILVKDLRINPSADNNNAIKWAIESGHTEIVKSLLNDPRVDPSAKDNDAIREASQNGHTEIVKLLLNDLRVDPSACNNEAIREASEKGHTEIVKILLNDPRVDPSAQDNHAIREASANGRTEVVKLLLNDPRVDPSAKNNDAIGRAKFAGHTEIIKLFRKKDLLQKLTRFFKF
jgi:hypothetical protein